MRYDGLVRTDDLGQTPKAIEDRARSRELRDEFLERRIPGRLAVVDAELGENPPRSRFVQHRIFPIGLVFDEQTPASLRQALVSLETQRFDRLELRKQAEAHGVEVFARRIRSFVERAFVTGDASA